MPSRDRSPTLPAAPLRALAGLLALLVFTLTLAVQSPLVHAWLHGSHKDSAAGRAHAANPPPALTHEADCAVTLFSQGILCPLILPSAVTPVLRLEATVAVIPVRVSIAAPARLHPPAHAPPASPESVA